MRLSLGRRFAVAFFIVLISVLLFSASFFQDNKEAFLFPLIVAVAMLVMSLISLFRESFDLSEDDFQPFPLIQLIPTLVIMFGGVMLVEVLGMYTTAFIVLSLVSLWYSPQENYKNRLIQSLLFAAGFSAFMYVLFTQMLNVQLPRGIFI